MTVARFVSTRVFVIQLPVILRIIWIIRTVEYRWSSNRDRFRVELQSYREKERKRVRENALAFAFEYNYLGHLLKSTTLWDAKTHFLLTKLFSSTRVVKYYEPISGETWVVKSRLDSRVKMSLTQLDGNKLRWELVWLARLQF